MATTQNTSESPIEELSYEQALNELESVIAALEAGEGSLETSVKLFERGQALAKYCSKLLDQAELIVRQISGDELVDVSPGYPTR